MPSRAPLGASLSAGAILLLGLLVQPCRAHPGSGDWSVRVWAFEGLTDRSIAALAQTSDGFLWAANRRGLARFDGARFTEIEPAALGATAGSRIRLIRPSRAGGLWIATQDRQLLHLDGARSRPLSVMLPDLRLDALLEDADGAVWIELDQGNLFRVQDNVLTDFTGRAGLGHGNLHLATDRDHRLWYAQQGVVGVFRDERFEPVARFPDSSIRMTPAAAGGVWIYSNAGLVRLTHDGVQVDFGPVPARSPTVLLEDRQGGLWIGTLSSGLHRFDGARFTPIPTSDATIDCLLEDAEGSIWAGTRRAGLNQIQPRTVTVEGATAGLQNEAVHSLAEDRDGVVWAVTREGALVRRDGGRWLPSHIARRSENRLTAIAASADGRLWAGTAHGDREERVYSIGPDATVSLGKAHGLTSSVINTLLVARNGDVWMSASSPSQIMRLRGAEATRLAPPPGSASDTFFALAEDSDGGIWVGSSQGRLFRVAGDAMVEESTAARPGSAVNALAADPAGGLWIGYAGEGLALLRGGTMTRFRPDHGMDIGGITHLLLDGGDGLWMAGDAGLHRASRARLWAVAEGRGPGVRPLHYGAEPGFPKLHAFSSSQGGALRTRDGRLWMTMGSALAIVAPPGREPSRLPPPARVTRVAADGRTVALYHGILPPGSAGSGSPAVGESPLEIAPSHQRLEFEFANLSLRAPENTAFRYRMFNYDETWSDAGSGRTATYRGLSAGDYRFEVVARDIDGVWNETPATVAFSVGRFFWQTPWFQGLGLLGFGAAIFAATRAASHRRLQRRVQILRQRAGIERERTRIARDIHDDIGNRLTRIILLAGLARKAPAGSTEADEQLDRIASAATEVTDSLDEIVWAVNPRNDTLSHSIGYISTFASDFLGTAGLRCRVHRPSEVAPVLLPAEIRHNLFLAVKESLSNIVRHAGASEAVLCFEIKEGVLRVTVEDNGRGFRSAEPSPDADGLRNMQERLEEIEGSFAIGERTGGGTRVTLSMPLAGRS